MSIPLWKLELLHYPRASLYRFGCEEETVALVAFLEDRHVRMWDVDRRSPLRKSGLSWVHSFSEYLKV